MTNPLPQKPSTLFLLIVVLACGLASILLSIGTFFFDAETASNPTLGNIIQDPFTSLGMGPGPTTRLKKDTSLGMAQAMAMIHGFGFSDHHGCIDPEQLPGSWKECTGQMGFYGQRDKDFLNWDQPILELEMVNGFRCGDFSTLPPGAYRLTVGKLETCGDEEPRLIVLMPFAIPDSEWALDEIVGEEDTDFVEAYPIRTLGVRLKRGEPLRPLSRESANE